MKKNIVLFAAACVLIITAVVVTLNYFGGTKTPGFVYGSPQNASGAAADPETTDGSILLCADPLNSVYLSIDGFDITLTGSCPEDTEIYADMTASVEMHSSVERNGTGYTARLFCADVPEKFGCGDAYVNIYFGEDKFDYHLHLTEEGFVLPRLGDIENVNGSLPESIPELPAENLAEYIGGDVTSILAQVRKLSDTICAGLTDDYDKARALAHWVSENIYYDFDARSGTVDSDTVSLSHILETHRSVCIGFTNLYSALCSAQGITCYNVSGDVLYGWINYKPSDKTGLHEWNIVVIDGRKINVDTVWNTQNAYRGGVYTRGETTSKYFDFSDRYLSLEHRARSAEHRDYFSLSE